LLLSKLAVVSVVVSHSPVSLIPAIMFLF